MSNEIDETQPIELETAPGEKKRSLSWLIWLISGWLLLFAVAIMGAYGGYQAGVGDVSIASETEVALEIESQYELGREDFSAGNCERAIQRFEFVLEQNPSHAGAQEMLARTLTCAFTTATPTVALPTAVPTLTPTPDTRNIETLFDDAKSKMAEGDWDGAITVLLNLRQQDPAYEAVDVDSMLYVALRNRGVNKILHKGELEGGLYDLSQAETFGPLDAEATSTSNFARFYLIGASFWQVDWGQAAYYFGQVGPYLPSLHDGSGWRAMDRYKEAQKNYVDLLILAKLWCLADQEIAIYLTIEYSDEYNGYGKTMHNECVKELEEDN
jgi:tetratricopeptide (TPR) repeat protein